MNAEQTIESVRAVLRPKQIEAIAAFANHGWKVVSAAVMIERFDSHGHIEIKEIHPSGAAEDYLDLRKK
jgi:hypothetical protein